MIRISLLIIFTFALFQIQAQDEPKRLGVSIAVGMHKKPINGIALSDTGLFAQRFLGYKRNIFGRVSSKYSSLFIAYEGLDSTVLYRLQIFLALHNYLYNIKSFPKIYETTETPSVFRIYNPNVNGNREILDYRYSDDAPDDLCHDRYLLNEITFLLNDLIPDKYSELKIMVWDRPSPERIKADAGY